MLLPASERERGSPRAGPVGLRIQSGPPAQSPSRTVKVRARTSSPPLPLCQGSRSRCCVGVASLIFSVSRLNFLLRLEHCGFFLCACVCFSHFPCFPPRTLTPEPTDKENAPHAGEGLRPRRGTQRRSYAEPTLKAYATRKRHPCVEHVVVVVGASARVCSALAHSLRTRSLAESK